MMNATCPIMRYHGGKWKISPWIINHFPPHKVYVEPFGGAASVLLRKPRAAAEVYNDLDGEIVNVFRVLRDPVAARQLEKAMHLTPYARTEFDLSNEPALDSIEQARRTLFRAWGSFGSAGATRTYSGFRTYTKPDGAYLGVAQAWCRIPNQINEYTERLRGVVIENRPAIEVMQTHDTPQTIHYVDPPYLPETRSFQANRYYRHEMTSDQHAALIDALHKLQGMVILSGYNSEFYREHLKGWQMASLATSGSSRYGSVPRTECIWINPAAARDAVQPCLFNPGQ